MRIIVFIVVAVVQLVAAAFGFLLLLLGLNGFSERQATPGLVFYIVVAVASSVGLGVAGAMAVKWLAVRRGAHALVAALVAVVGSSVLGLVILGAGFLGAVVLAEIMRNAR